jgi:hypothetical protein
MPRRTLNHPDRRRINNNHDRSNLNFVVINHQGA